MSKEKTERRLPPGYRPDSWFAPADEEEHERGNRGERVSDYCRNCASSFMEHTNGVCP